MIQLHKELPLNIYRASAGSGKTHLLTGFYIKLLFDQDQLPQTHSGEMKFSEILAVTFTNKATAEMKGRIIDELYLLSTNPAKSDYWEDVTSAGTDRNDAKAAVSIRNKATQLLVQILNEYSAFNISTIDSFFLRIVRSFARELNIPGNYEVELNADFVLDAAVSNFLDKLDAKTNRQLFDWMVDFSKQRLADGAGWDVHKVLFDMARKVLTSETYRKHSDRIRQFTDDKAALRQYANSLQTTQRKWRELLQGYGEEGMRLLSDYGVSITDFKWAGSGTVSNFSRWAAGEDSPPSSARFQTGVADPESMYKNKPSQDYIDRMQNLMQRCWDHFNTETYIHYKTACAIRSHFYELGIMANLDKELIDYCNEQNTMLLSSTTDMLSRLIGQDDAPFIYEKTGTRIHSYMIDEFQDTSGMQWGNFQPLVSNALAEGYQNLIVGDVKQSIYRWRGGDWNLLNSEINRFEPDRHYDDEKALGTNWRSLPAIIGFNNSFFPWLAERLDLMLSADHHLIRDIYHDVEQEIPSKRKGDDKPQGLLHIGFLCPTDADGNTIEKPKKEDFLNEAARRLPEAIIKLQESGFQAKDIAILCRRNNECRWAAEALLRYKQDHPECTAVLDIISSEALQLSSRPIIQIIISLMRHLQSPASPILSAVANISYQRLCGLAAEEAVERYFALPKAERLFHPELANRQFYEMAEQLIQLMPAECRESEAPFLQAFRDLVLEYASRQSADLAGFLNWWDQTGSSKSITTPEGQNAIQILSVHKSKGLGMPAVVMPFASWNLDIDTSHDEIIWCEPKAGPFVQDVLLPLKLDKDLADTIFANDYLEERRRAVIDNLNTAYVALTRAKEAMVILAPKPQKSSYYLESWLHDYCHEQGDDNGLTIGEWQRQEVEEKPEQQKSDLPFDEEDERSNELPLLSILHDPAKPDITAKLRGNYIHAALQEIHTADEAEAVIHRLYLRGDIDPETISEAEMNNEICRLLKMPLVSTWFQPGLTIYNELTFMDAKGKQQRPDRIVVDSQGKATIIDYKTGSSHPGYRRQVKRYMEMLQQIGFQQVEGYLLFLKDEKIVKV